MRRKNRKEKMRREEGGGRGRRREGQGLVILLYEQVHERSIRTLEVQVAFNYLFDKMGVCGVREKRVAQRGKEWEKGVKRDEKKIHVCIFQ